MKKRIKMCKLLAMQYKKYSINVILLILMTFSIGFSQFFEVEVEVDMRRLSEGDRQLLYSLKDELKKYFMNTQFSEDSDIELIIHFRLVIEFHQSHFLIKKNYLFSFYFFPNLDLLLFYPRFQHRLL